MTHHRGGLWQGLVVAMLMVWLTAGCAGMQKGASAEGPQDQVQQPVPLQELPPSSVEMQAEEAPPEPPPPDNLIHTVSFEGETLSLIAKWYTGSYNNWRELAAANPGVDPHRIFMGNEIRIPSEMLITREPMPRSFVRGK